MATKQNDGLKSLEDKTPGSGKLSRDDLCSMLRRQIQGRNSKYSKPEFHRILAEEVAITKIGDFYYGERILARPEDPGLREKAEKFELIGTPENAYRITGGPVETMENPCDCTDLTGLTIEGAHLSGSKLEGSDVRFNGNPWEWSDIDVMLQLGPVEMRDRSEANSSRSTSRRSSSVKVVPESVRQKGFFLLHHERLSSCRHSKRHLFSGYRLKKKLLNVVRMNGFQQGDVCDYTFEGPSIASDDKATSADIVTCVSFPPWPSEEFASRARRSGHPSASLVSRLCRTPALLVPVGSAGSEAKLHEWRLSFSRHEFLAHRAMPQILCDCLAVLKHANAVVNGPHGSLKGFQLKTSVLWLAELHSKDSLERRGFCDCLLLVLQFVDQSAASGRLDCYFWTEINLLGGRADEDLRKLRKAVGLLRDHLDTALRVLVAVFVRYGDSGVQDTRLPPRSYGRLWEFMFPGVRIKHSAEKPGEIPDVYPVPGTWMSQTNIAKLFSSRNRAMPLYDTVLQKTESPLAFKREQAARERKMTPVRWTDDC